MMTTNRSIEFSSRRAIRKGKKDIPYYPCQEENERHSPFFPLIGGRGGLTGQIFPAIRDRISERRIEREKRNERRESFKR